MMMMVVVRTVVMRRPFNLVNSAPVNVCGSTRRGRELGVSSRRPRQPPTATNPVTA
jgi:hypothetical protein